MGCTQFEKARSSCNQPFATPRTEPDRDVALSTVRKLKLDRSSLGAVGVSLHQQSVAESVHKPRKRAYSMHGELQAAAIAHAPLQKCHTSVN